MALKPSPRQRRRRDQLAVSHRDLVPPIAGRYAHCSPEPFEDLLQVGLLGLLRAAETYTETSTVPFASYARPHIRGAILHHLRDRAWLVRLPRRQAELQQRLSQACSASSLQLANAEQERLQRWAALVRPLSLETIALQSAIHGGELVESGASFDSPEDQVAAGYCPDALDTSWQHHSLEELMGLVDLRQQQVLRCVVLQGWSYRRTAAALSVSAATVQRVVHAALTQLRLKLSQQRLSSRQQRPDPSVAAAS